jgi:hypothetical protein
MTDNRSPRWLKENAPDEIAEPITSRGEKLGVLRRRAYLEFGEMPPEVIAELDQENAAAK